MPFRFSDAAAAAEIADILMLADAAAAAVAAVFRPLRVYCF